MLKPLHDLLAKHSIETPVTPNTNKPTRHGSQWLILKTWEMAGKSFAAATFGDFKTGLKESWESTDKKTATKEEIAAAKKNVEEMIELEREEKRIVHLEQAEILSKEFETFASTGDTPYLRRKQIAGELYGARIKPNESGDPIVIVPLRDVQGKLWNFQRIYSQKLSKGDKFFAEGARIEGCFHILRTTLEQNQSHHAPETIYLCEGFATAVSIRMALGNPNGLVVAAFNAQNLTPAAVSLKEKYPSAKIVVCADNDVYTIIRDKPTNVGIEKGRRAAGSTSGEIRYPVFKYPQKGLTDFNDLHTAEGLEVVKDQIENFSKYVNGIQPMVLSVSRNGKVSPPTEKEVTEYMLKEFNGRLVKTQKALFFYKGTHWEEMNQDGLDKIKQWISVAANGMLGSRDLQAYLNHLVIFTPAVPHGVDMYQPNPRAANFQDGTLHLLKSAGGKFSLEFKPHDKTDYLTSTLPFPYPGDVTKGSLPAAPKFDALIERLWANNADRENCLRFAYQTIGATLMPNFPLIVFFWGKPNSGKSTWIKLLVKLIGYENVCSVPPSEFYGFNMESMIGKLINYDTDLDVNKPMQDAEVKKLIDRTPRPIKRKFRSVANAYIPAVHLFAANDLPRSLDGSSKAYGRRLIVVHTESYKAGSDRVFDFEEVLLDSEREAIVARGILGLKDLVENQGQFTIPQGSKESIDRIEKGSDVLTQFLDDVEVGEIKNINNTIIRNPQAAIGRAELWEVFDNWQEASLPHKDKIGKHELFNKLDRLGFKVHKTEKRYEFRGLGILAENGAVS